MILRALPSRPSRKIDAGRVLALLRGLRAAPPDIDFPFRFLPRSSPDWQKPILIGFRVDLEGDATDKAARELSGTPARVGRLQHGETGRFCHNLAPHLKTSC